MKAGFLIFFVLIQSVVSGQLDIFSVSFEKTNEFPNEIHYSDSVEYEKLRTIIEKANDPDTAFLFQGLDCLWWATHDTSEYSREDYGTYSIGKNIHFGDFNGDKKEDCIIDFAIWGCTAYFCKAYLTHNGTYKIIKHKSGFITDLKLTKGKISEIQNIRYESPMYGFDFINQLKIAGNKTTLKYVMEFDQDSDSLIKSNYPKRLFIEDKDTATIYYSIVDWEKKESKYPHAVKYKLKDKKIQILNQLFGYYLALIEVEDKNQYEKDELIPEKYYICGWMKKEDLE